MKRLVDTGPFATTCWGETDFHWQPRQQRNIDSGRGPGFPVGGGGGPELKLMFAQGGTLLGEPCELESAFMPTS